MYKTYNAVAVFLAVSDSPLYFEDTDTKGYGTTVLNQIKTYRDIDSMESTGALVNTIVPYHAIDHAIVESDRGTMPDHVDDNCNTGSGVEPGTLKIVNASDNTLGLIAVLISEALDGTYGDLTFSTDESDEPIPDGYNAWALVERMAPGVSVTATGLPDNGRVLIEVGPNVYHATIPAVVNISGGIK